MKKISKLLTLISFLSIGVICASCGDNVTSSSQNEQPTKVEIYKSYCEFAGNMFMSGKGDLGPLPAETIFYTDYTWTAEATGKAMYSDFRGSWSYSSSTGLAMKLLEQDGVAKEGEDQIVVIDSSDERIWSWTLSHPDDRGTSMKYHNNHMSRYNFLKAYNEKLNKIETLPTEPTFKLTFDNGIYKSGWTGETKVGELTGEMSMVLEGHVGDQVTLPSCGFTREGYTFTNYTIVDGVKTTAEVGSKYTIRDYDMVIRSNFVENK